LKINLTVRENNKRRIKALQCSENSHQGCDVMCCTSVSEEATTSIIRIEEGEGSRFLRNVGA
jgi:hypothetical protein